MNLTKIISVRTTKTIYRDKDACIKVFNANYSKADVLNEALNQARIEETGLNIPKIREVMMIEGKWAIVYDYIEGESLYAKMKKNPEKMEEYLNLFVDLQMEVHSKRCTELSLLRNKMTKKIEMADLDAVVRYDLHTRIAGMPKHVKVCHGDFNPSNIVITPEGKPYIIDWAHVTQGNASADVARSYLLFCLHGDEDIAKRYLDLFCQKSKIDIKNIQRWMPIVAASQSVKGNKEERETLLKWVNVVDYQ